MKETKDELYQAILGIEEAKLKAQLKAIRKMISPEESNVEVKPKRMSQIDVAYNILYENPEPMHVSRIINQAKQVYNLDLDRESLVSAISKKVSRNDRFIRTDKNTFTIIRDKKGREK